MSKREPAINTGTSSNPKFNQDIGSLTLLLWSLHISFGYNLGVLASRGGLGKAGSFRVD